MNLRRTTHLFLTALPRAIHRRGFGVQSPWAYELIRDVLFESLHYYAYDEQGLNNPMEQQLFRIRNHFKEHPIVVIEEKGKEATQQYEEAVQKVTPDTVLIIEHIHDENADLWTQTVKDPRAIITFDMRKRGMVIFDSQRIKQNYLL
jgi:nucleoside-triphosphatase THEP1